MKLTSVLVTVLVSVGLQMAAARVSVGGRWQIDLVLVGVTYAALIWGPVAGMTGAPPGVRVTPPMVSSRANGSE